MRKIGLVFAILLIPVLLFAAGGCWNSVEISEIDGFADMDDMLVISVKDAETCQPVQFAKIDFGSHQFQANGMGYISVPKAGLETVEDAVIPVAITAPGYIPLTHPLRVSLGSVMNPRVILSRPLGVGAMRFVLTWEDEPEDLDLHFVAPDYHISYRNQTHIPGKARLDRDDKDGFGPETITAEKMTAGVTYKVYVRNFSPSGLIDGASLLIFSGMRLLERIELDGDDSPAVFAAEIRNGQIRVQNRPVNAVGE